MSAGAHAGLDEELLAALLHAAPAVAHVAALAPGFDDGELAKIAAGAARSCCPLLAQAEAWR